MGSACLLLVVLLACPPQGPTGDTSARDSEAPPPDQDQDGHPWPQDCDDQDPTVHPGATEAWYDGVDQDCDGNDADQDGDGFDQERDCDDSAASVHPGAAEAWYDGVDQDCDGNDDDQDGDGWSPATGDCDDTRGQVSPTGQETWNDLDDDCDGVPDDLLADSSLTAAFEGPPCTWLGATLSVGDVDGDGQHEILAGSPETGPGTVWVLAPSLPGGPAADVALATTSGASSANGLALMGPTQGDVTGDGLPDLTLAGNDRQGGLAVAVFEGGPGLVGSLSTAQARVTFQGAQGEGYAQVASHLDLDGDGAKELVYGDYFASAPDLRGAIWIHRLAGQTGAARLDDADGSLFGSSDQDHLGATLGGGDLDGDGYEDLVAGAYGVDRGANLGGATCIFAGSAALPANVTADGAARACILGSTESGYLGYGASPLVVDLDADGHLDLVLGEPETGRALVFGHAADLVGSVEASSATTVLGGYGPTWAGASLAAGPVLGAGSMALALGAPDATSARYASVDADNPGEVHALDDVLGQGTAGPDQDRLRFTASQRGAFGFQVQALPLDGKAGLLVSEPGWEGDRGRVALFVVP